MSKGIYTKENVGNGVFIFTVNKNFVEPKFWGLHEENEQAQCVVIIHDGNALFFYPEDMIMIPIFFLIGRKSKQERYIQPQKKA